MPQLKARITSQRQTGPRYFKMNFSAPSIARKASPGQFVSIRVSGADAPLLRRPFGIHRVKGKDVEILYEVLGSGTETLARLKAGSLLDVLGPLGNGFVFQAKQPRAVLIAGGMGVAPLVFLAEKLKECAPIVLLGARTEKQILCEKEFKKLGCKVIMATDDGSKGHRGPVTNLWQQAFAGQAQKPALVYACGPKPMLREVARLARRQRVSAQVSLEEHMACGIGACLGCVVSTVEGYRRVCKEGPVFEADQIIWE